MPLGVGDMPTDEQSMDPLAGAGETRRFRSSSIVIVVVVLVACGGLWFMRSLSHVAGATGSPSDVELTIEKFLGGRDSKGNAKVVKGASDASVLAVLSQSYTEEQVPLENVQRNPFILPGESDNKIVAAVTGDDPAEVVARARGARQKDIDAAAAKLAVKSIIMSTQPLANISGMIVRVGDEIAPEGSDITFRIQSITADTVTLVTDDIALGMHVEVPLSMRRDK